MAEVTIRAYEQNNLPLDKRLTSLARRFPCLKNAQGIEPWNAEVFYRWSLDQKKLNNEIDNSLNHTCLFLLNLAEYKKCEPFNILSASKVWEDADKQMFINWMRIWKF